MRVLSCALAIAISPLLFFAFPGTSLGSARVELSLGGTVPRTDVHQQPYTDMRPSLATVLSIRPKSWPVGVITYASAMVRFFEDITFAFPEDDFVTAKERLFDGDVGIGLEKEVRSGSTRLALGGGLMTGTTDLRVTSGGKARVFTYPGSGPWLTAAISSSVSKRLEVGGRALYAWKGVTMPYDDWERKGGGLLLGLGIGYRIQGSHQ